MNDMKRNHLIATVAGGAAGLAVVGGIVATALPEGAPGAPPPRWPTPPRRPWSSATC
ncbi:hypothetical protein ACFQXA_00940 [Nocardiopsis composta]